MNPALDQLAAKKRIRRFFDEPVAERRAVSHFVQEISVCASAYVFGGALRDIALLGAARFESDVDIVVQVNDHSAFTDILEQFEATQNKFGGYRARFGRWNFDIWEVDRTWAFSVGAVKARGHLSLLETTFFNWDAILYDCRTSTLHHRPNYFSDLSAKYLELVLEDNPNTVGAFVRSLRTLCLSDEILAGPKLSKFIKEQLEKTSNQEILAYEQLSFRSKRLSDGVLTDLRSRASEWNYGKPFRWLPQRQLSFFEGLAS